MANQNYNNNNTQAPQVSTRGYHTSNSGAVKATAFEWSFQGEMLRLVTSEELPENEQTEKRRYDYDHSWITCLTRIKCLDLADQIKKVIFPAITEKKNKFVSVTVGTVNQFGVGVKFDDNGKITCYTKLIRNIDPENLTSSEEISYEFRKGEVIIDYDNGTGKFGDRIQNETEMYLFLRDLESFVNAGSKAYIHANRVVDKTYKDMISCDLRAIGSKVGAEVSTPYSAQRAGARTGQQSLFDNNAMTAPSETIKTLSDLELPFD